jgi:hypothetical protein
MILSKDQIAMIRAAVDDQKITIVTLKDDLVDHLCCLVEIKMERGNSFENAVRDSLSELAPGGLIAIEQETLFLINFNKLLFMKKLTFFCGALCALAMALGFFLGMMKVAIGHMIFGLGAFAFITIFVPIDAVRYFRLTKDSLSEKVGYVFSSSCTIILATGVLSRIMFLPGADEMLIAGLVIFVAGFLPLQFIKLYKNTFREPKAS